MRAPTKKQTHELRQAHEVGPGPRTLQGHSINVILLIVEGNTVKVLIVHGC